MDERRRPNLNIVEFEKLDEKTQEVVKKVANVIGNLVGEAVATQLDMTIKVLNQHMYFLDIKKCDCQIKLTSIIEIGYQYRYGISKKYYNSTDCSIRIQFGNTTTRFKEFTSKALEREYRMVSNKLVIKISDVLPQELPPPFVYVSIRSILLVLLSRHGFTKSMGVSIDSIEVVSGNYKSVVVSITNLPHEIDLHKLHAEFFGNNTSIIPTMKILIIKVEIEDRKRKAE